MARSLEPAFNPDPTMPDQTELAEYASPPCFMHELSPEFRNEPFRSDAWGDVCRWRKAERQRLIGERMALSPDDREIRSARIASLLDLTIGKVAGRVVGTYWPFRGEPDLRNWGIRVLERGGRLALPVVIQKGWPLEYRIWSPGDPLERGVWNILVPSRGPAVLPDVVRNSNWRVTAAWTRSWKISCNAPRTCSTSILSIVRAAVWRLDFEISTTRA